MESYGIKYTKFEHKVNKYIDIILNIYWNSVILNYSQFILNLNSLAQITFSYDHRAL
jgi:hypothetical protein